MIVKQLKLEPMDEKVEFSWQIIIIIIVIIITIIIIIIIIIIIFSIFQWS